MPRSTRFPGSRYMRTTPPDGFGVKFQVMDDGLIEAQFVFDRAKEGPPDHAHGGAVATVLDEAMGTAVYEADRLGYTITMTVNYHIAIPLEVPLTVRARVDGFDGQKTYASAEIVLEDGRKAADSTGLFIRSERLQQRLEATRPPADSSELY